MQSGFDIPSPTKKRHILYMVLVDSGRKTLKKSSSFWWLLHFQVVFRTCRESFDPVRLMADGR